MFSKEKTKKQVDIEELFPEYTKERKEKAKRNLQAYLKIVEQIYLNLKEKQ